MSVLHLGLACLAVGLILLILTPWPAVAGLLLLVGAVLVLAGLIFRR